MVQGGVTSGLSFRHVVLGQVSLTQYWINMNGVCDNGTRRNVYSDKVKSVSEVEECDSLFRKCDEDAVVGVLWAPRSASLKLTNHTGGAANANPNATATRMCSDRLIHE